MFVFIILVPRNYCNTAQFIRISPDVNPVEVKDLFIGQNHKKVKMFRFNFLFEFQ
jgi:hypothetical protein